MKHIDEHERFVGRLVVSFQQLELAMLDLFAMLVAIDEPDVGYIVSDGLSFKKLAACIDALAKHRNITAHSRIAKTLSKCCELEEVRNKYVHSYWDATLSKEFHLQWVHFKRRNKLGRGSRCTEEVLVQKVEAFVLRSDSLQQLLRRETAAIRKSRK